MIHAGKVLVTLSALTDGAAMGFDVEGIIDVIMALTTKDFHNSMTTHVDHRIWKDLYHPATPAGEVYLKLTVIDEVIIVSLKEL